MIIREKNKEEAYNDIHDLLWQANASNREQGFHLRTAEYTEQELKNKIGEDGKTFLAMDEEVIAGTISVRYVKRNKWYYKGVLPDYIFAAVAPGYQGQGVNSLLSEAVFNEVKNKGYKAIELETASRNAHAIAVYKHLGFKLVDFVHRGKADHHSVVMIKWFENQPYSELKRKVNFMIRKVKTVIKFSMHK